MWRVHRCSSIHLAHLLTRLFLLFQVYTVLIDLAAVDELLPTVLTSTTAAAADQSVPTPTVKCTAAMGQLTRALTGLLWRHGDTRFQSYTDCIPSYFHLIANLHRWVNQPTRSTNKTRQLLQQSQQQQPSDLAKRQSAKSMNTAVVPAGAVLVLPELVEELFDFEAEMEEK